MKMGRSMFLKLDGVRGNSMKPGHVGSIEISGFTWGNERRQLAASIAGPGKITINDLTIFKPPDVASPRLRSASASGQHFPEGSVTVEEFSKTGTLLSTAIIKLRSILIDFVSASGSMPPSQHGFTEAVALNFASYEISRS